MGEQEIHYDASGCEFTGTLLFFIEKHPEQSWEEFTLHIIEPFQSQRRGTEGLKTQ
jgi:hypothetical protein